MIFINPERSKKGFDFFSCLVIILLFFTNVNFVDAFDSSSPNNKYGIHLAQPEERDIQRASDLVNSTGGTWGYITLVIQENDRDKNKWQNVFNQLRKARLIPIIRLATHPEGAHWKRPTTQDVSGWVNFLNSLTWVVKDRYIVLFNEPNHGSEWGEQVDPEGYADTALAFAKGLKERNREFFIMLAGLDAAAPSAPPAYEDEAVFLSQIYSAKPELFELIDGWSSHSYPNPGFRGGPADSGRNTVRNYEWELSYLKTIGVVRELPVFITEAGWPHSSYTPDVVGSYLTSSFENIWIPDVRVRAVTPFILNYQGEPFASFSWLQPGGDQVYAHYIVIQGLPKIEGEPEIIQKGLLWYKFPQELLVRSAYHFKLEVKNQGQAYWDRSHGYSLKLEGLEDKEYFFSDLSGLNPGDKKTIDLYLKTDAKEGRKKARVQLFKNDKKIIEGKEWVFEKLPLPSLNFDLSFFPKFKPQEAIVEIQIFDSDEQLVYKRKEVEVRKNKGVVNEIANIALGERYRIVVLRPYYLPRQTIIVFKKGQNITTFKQLLPLDFDLNGALNFGDIGALFRKPYLIWTVVKG